MDVTSILLAIVISGAAWAAQQGVIAKSLAIAVIERVVSCDIDVPAGSVRLAVFLACYMIDYQHSFTLGTGTGAEGSQILFPDLYVLLGLRLPHCHFVTPPGQE